jgi:GAF domain-containing protein
MPAAPLPADEATRLEALRRSGLLESGPDPRLDDIVRRAAALAGTTVAAISLVAGADQFFKAGVGFGVPHVARNVSFCAYVLLEKDPLIVPDARRDPRFADNALVVRPPGIRFYLGMPVYGIGSQPFGALFVLDTEPREAIPPALVEALSSLADEASALLASCPAAG